jgi:hypothetical protein
MAFEFDDVLETLGRAAEQLVPLIGGAKGQAAVEIAQAVIGLGGKVKEILGEDDAVVLTERLLPLEERVTTKARETAAGLRGG